MAIFGKLFGSKQSATAATAPDEQAVIIRLDTHGLPQEIYDANDLATLEDQIVATLEQNSVGEFDGNEIGSDSTVLYLYGPDAEKLFLQIEPVLRVNPLCQQGKAVIRKGKPGAQQREVAL